MLSGCHLQSHCAICRPAVPTAGPRRQHLSVAALASAEQANASQAAQAEQTGASRRALVGSAAAVIAALSLDAPRAHAGGATGAEVGGYLPKAGIDDLVQYVPGKNKPALKRHSLLLLDTCRPSIAYLMSTSVCLQTPKRPRYENRTSSCVILEIFGGLESATARESPGMQDQ